VTNETLKDRIAAAHVDQGCPSDLAEEIAILALALEGSVAATFLEMEKHASCPEVMVGAALCGAQLVIAKMMELLEAAKIEERGVRYEMKGSVH
jgi:hypothetical protein